MILSVDFYPNPCETEKSFLNTIFLKLQTLLVQGTYYVVVSTAPCMGYWVTQMFCVCFHRRLFPRSLYFYSILLFSQIFSTTLSMTWFHTDQWLFNFRLFVWDLAVPESMQPADIRPHPTSPQQGDEYLQVTYLLTSRCRLLMSRFDTYSIADTMYDPEPNLKNCCKAGDDGNGEEEDDGFGERQWGRLRASFDECIDNGNDCIKGTNGNNHRLICKHLTRNVSGKIFTLSVGLGTIAKGTAFDESYYREICLTQDPCLGLE